MQLLHAEVQRVEDEADADESRAREAPDVTRRVYPGPHHETHNEPSGTTVDRRHDPMDRERVGARGTALLNAVGRQVDAPPVGEAFELEFSAILKLQT
jgi:hypothetical protein